RRRDDSFAAAHPALRIRLEVGAERHAIADAAAIEAAERRRVAVAGAGEAERREYAGIEPKLAQSFGELRLIEEDVKFEPFGSAGIVGDRQLDVVRTLRKREVLQVVGPRIEFDPAHELPIDPNLDKRAPFELEASAAARTDDGLRFEYRVTAGDAHAGDFGRRLEPPRDRHQVARRPTDELVTIVVDQAGAAALEVHPCRTGLPVGLGLKNQPFDPCRTVQE